MPLKDKIYTALCLLFTLFIVIGNLTYQKFVTLPLLPFYTFELSVGVIFYPFTYMLTDLIAEFYGKERANFCVKLGVACDVIAVAIITLMVNLHATPWSPLNDEQFSMMFGSYAYAFLASVTACYISQRLDILVYLGIKKKTAGKMLYLRSFVSTSLSLLLDTFIVHFILIFLGVLPQDKMLSLVGNSYSFKLCIALLCIPLFYLAVMSIKYFTRRSVLPKQAQVPAHINK
jgi:hypothetical protein